MAFRFAHLLRRLFGEGALHSAFIPHYEQLRLESPKRASRFFYDLTRGLATILLILVLVTEMLLFPFLHGAHHEVILLTMTLLPAVLFICLFALNSALLNCEHSYFLPSVSPALLNIIWIAALFFLMKAELSLAMQRLAFVVVGAFALQWLITLPRVAQVVSKAEGEKSSLKSLFAILKPFLLGMLGVAAVQINSALDAIFARAADPQGPAFLWYALRLQQLPLALFGVGLAAAFFPPIARAIQNQEYQRYHEFLRFAVQRAISWMLPISFALLSLGFASVNLVYGHGHFSLEATYTTSYCLIAYGAALVPMTLTMLFASAFYAVKNYKTPALFSCFSVLLNVGLNALFVFGFHWGAASIAVATALSSAVNALLLAWILTVTQEIKWVGLSEDCAKLVIASLMAASLTLFVGRYLPQAPRELWRQLEVVGIEGALFATVFLTAAWLLRTPFYSTLLSRSKL